MEWTRSDLVFNSVGDRCAAWLYLPKGVRRPPVVVMAHGFGAERSFGLAAFAERFAARGMACFVFDHRGFGASEGEPRNFVHPGRHLEDWAAALAHVRGLGEIETTRIALWGTSFAGGHALVTAARDREIAAVVAQVPHIDALASLSHVRPGTLLAVHAAAIEDAARGALGLRPRTIPIAAEPHETGFLTFPGWKRAYLDLVPEGSDWRNEAPARGLFSIAFYRPIREVERIRCPVLMVYAARDEGIPPALVERAAERIRDVQTLRLDCDHFDVYAGPQFERAVEAEGEFLAKRLLGL